MHLDPDMLASLATIFLAMGFVGIGFLIAIYAQIITRKDSDMSEFTDALDAAAGVAIAKINGAGADTQALTKKNADLQAQLDAANANITKNADALNGAVNPVAPAPVVEPAPQPTEVPAA